MHGKCSASSPTPSRSSFRSRCLDRERFTIAGDWTTTTRWTSSFIRTASKAVLSWTSYRRTEFHTSRFARRFRALPLVHTYTSADHLTVTDQKLMKTLFVYLTILLLPTIGNAQMKTSESLTEKQASHFAALALKCVTREFPNKPEHVINNASEVSSPKMLHPAFYGCYDWHSSVHGHWMLVRLLRMFPNLPEAQQIRKTLGANLSADNVDGEVKYLKQPNRQSFERTYGWAWLLKLAEELSLWDDAEGKAWSRN